MKKYSLVLIVILLCIVGADNRQAKAYSVTLQKDGMYAEMLPDLIVNNVTVLFKKRVKRAMQYYKKYKDADTFTLATKVPVEYLDFIPVARKIQDSDEIIIRNPFFIYIVEGQADYSYYFAAEKKGERLCLFSVSIAADTGKVIFGYDDMMDRYFLYDEKTMKDALLYSIDDITYAQTPKETTVIRDQKQRGIHLMEGAPTYEKERKAFKKKNYEEKKEEIFAFLEEIKNQKVIKKSEKNLKLELKDEYIETEKNTKEDGIWKSIYIAAGVVAIEGITVGIIFRKKRKKSRF